MDSVPSYSHRKFVTRSDLIAKTIGLISYYGTNFHKKSEFSITVMWEFLLIFTTDIFIIFTNRPSILEKVLDLHSFTTNILQPCNFVALDSK